MRLEGQEKAGYYPTPIDLIPSIGAWLGYTPIAADDRPTLKYRVLDPCAGDGQALFALCEPLKGQVVPHAIELDEGRGEWLRAREFNFGYGRSIVNDAFDTIVASESMALLYLNPPYDSAFDVKGVRRQRAELLFLKQFTPALFAPGGVLVFVIPQSLLRNPATTKYLAACYDNFMVARFDNANDIFKQVVVYATRKSERDPDNAVGMRLTALGHIEWRSLPALPSTGVPLDAEGQPPYRLLPVEDAGERVDFRRISLEPEEIAERAMPVHDLHLAAAKQVIGRLDIRTATPPRAGHISMLIPAGVTNGTMLEVPNPDSDPESEEAVVSSTILALLKGRLRRTQDVSYEEEDVSTDDQRRIAKRTIRTDRIRSEVVLLDAGGNAHVVEAREMPAFLERHMTPLVEELNKRMRPYYDFKSMNGFETRIRSLNPHRRIPNTDKRGLMIAQQHATAAAATVLKHERAAVVVGEMGTGKTLIGAGVAAALHAHGMFRRGVVVCPPHLVGKWLEEIKITWPACKAMKIETAGDVEALHQHPGPVLGVVKSTTLSLGPGWEHAFDMTGATRLATRTDKEPFEFVLKPKPWIMAKDAAEVAKHTITARSKKKLPLSGVGPDMLLGYRNRRGIRCPVCGAKQEYSLGDFRRRRLFCENKACRSALFQFTSETRRWPLSRVFKRAAKRYGPLDLLVADEVQTYKAGDSDRGYAFGHLCGATNKTLALTGTLFGGKASTIFWLLYRMMPKFRAMFTNDGATGTRRIQEEKFLKEYGLLEETETTIEKDGKTSANAKSTTVSKEIPGLVPSLINFLLPYCIFINLADLGYALPPYKEDRVALALPADMQNEYDRVLGELYKAVSKALALKDKGLLGIYLSILMTWPEIPSRQRSAYTRDGQHIVTTNPFSESRLTPKEEAILKHIKRSLAENRRVMLFLEMTHKTDITPRWKELLRREGISSAVCNADPDKRIEWFNRERDKGTQVILVHPKRVELGLDLYAWPEVIWMHEHTYSSYLLLQASRRAWRIGQKDPVNVTFYYYRDTMQAHGLAITQQKALAHMRVNGGVIDDDSAIDDGIDSMEQMLGQLLIAQVDLQHKLSHARLYLADVRNGNRRGPTADSFPELHNLPDDELIASLEKIIDETEEELDLMNPASTLDTLFAQKTSLIDGIRTNHMATYAVSGDVDKYFELDAEPDDQDGITIIDQVDDGETELDEEPDMADEATDTESDLIEPANEPEAANAEVIDEGPAGTIVFQEVPAPYGEDYRLFLTIGPNALKIADQNIVPIYTFAETDGVTWIEVLGDDLIDELAGFPPQVIERTPEELEQMAWEAEEAIRQRIGAALQLDRHAKLPTRGERLHMEHIHIIERFVAEYVAAQALAASQEAPEPEPAEAEAETETVEANVEEQPYTLTIVKETTGYVATGDDADIISDLLSYTSYGGNSGINENGDLWIELVGEEVEAAIAHIINQGYEVEIVNAAGDSDDDETEPEPSTPIRLALPVAKPVVKEVSHSGTIQIDWRTTWLGDHTLHIDKQRNPDIWSKLVQLIPNSAVAHITHFNSDRLEASPQMAGLVVKFLTANGFTVNEADETNDENESDAAEANAEDHDESDEVEANAQAPQEPPAVENRLAPPTAISNAKDVIEIPTRETPAAIVAESMAEQRLYHTWDEFYDLLMARAVTPERAGKAKKDGKPIKQAYTITEDQSQGMPRGRYLPVFSNNTLWLYLLRPNKPAEILPGETLDGIEDPLSNAVVVGTEVFFKEGLHQIQIVQRERWKVVAE